MTDNQNNKISLNVVSLMPVNRIELFNAIRLANSIQNSFCFSEIYDAIDMDIKDFLLPNKGVYLDKVIEQLYTKPFFRNLCLNYLIIVTGLPFSEPNAIREEPTEIMDGFYFYLPHRGPNRRISIVSTYIWERLPERKDLRVLAPSGRRALQPYILLGLADAALANFIDVPEHVETRSCPMDYCHYVEELDLFFEKGEFCWECENLIRKNVREGRLNLKIFNSIRRMLYRCAGKPLDTGYDSCFISYGLPDKKFAIKIYYYLTKKGIKCYLYELCSKAGNQIWQEIKQARRCYDRLLVICSSKALIRDGVLKEIEGQIEDDPEKILPVYVEREWLKDDFIIKRGSIDLKHYLVTRNFVDFSEFDFETSIKKLLFSLQWD